ncbi:MAG: SDR family NAD(P)-dependent oxidoreductase [Bacillota bacterium]
MNKRLLSTKVALVTGASRGIGKAIVERFAEEGCIVYANSRKTNIDEWARMLSTKYSTEVIPVYFDVTNSIDVKKTILDIKKNHLSIDVLVNNAAISSNELIGMISKEKMKSMFDTNVYSVIDIIQFAARLMKKQQSGSIINISSIVGVQGDKGQLLYSATKGAIIALTKSAAKELAPYNIRVNSVAPGLTDTDMFRQIAKDHLESRLSNIGMGRLATPIDIANSCLFLASDLSSYVSGEIIGVNGCSVL